MITKITGEQPFQVLTNNFSISPSNEGYTLQISADGKEYSNLFSVGAGVTRLVTGVAANSYYRLLGNQSKVSINWMKVCVTEGGGGAAGNELVPQDSLPATADAGTVVALTDGGVYQYDGTDWIPVGGSDMRAYWTSAQTKTYVDSGDTATYAAASAYTDEAIAEALAPYWDSAATKEYVDSADTIVYNSAATYIASVESHLFDVEEVTSSALTELHDGLLEVSARSISTEEIELPIAAAINEVRDTFAIKLDQQYYKKQEVNNILARKMEASQVNLQIKNYVDPAIAEVNSTIENKELAISAAINDLNERTVKSESIKNIWSGSQSDYDALTNSGATADQTTFYVIL